jgi:hypothetical protein
MNDGWERWEGREANWGDFYFCKGRPKKWVVLVGEGCERRREKEADGEKERKRGREDIGAEGKLKVAEVVVVVGSSRVSE